MFKHGELTGQVIEAFYVVYGRLGFGFLEKVYENALALELRERGLTVVQQAPISVLYNGVLVGEYFADLLVDPNLRSRRNVARRGASRQPCI